MTNSARSSDRASVLAGRVALVTGASRGTGRAIALRLAREGMAVALLARDPAGLAAVRSEVEAIGGRALAVPADVTDEAAVEAAFAQTRATFGGLDALINNAGISRSGPVERYMLADWRATLETNLTGVFLCSRAAIPLLRERGGGHILAISSGAGKTGYAGLAAYSASKFGLMGFMQSLAEELRPQNVRVSTIVPGSILTDFGARSAAEKARDPTRRYIAPEDVADAVVFLLTQPARAWTQEMNLWPF